MEWWFPLVIFFGVVVCAYGICKALWILASAFQDYVNKVEIDR
jgi:hypothetical protein